MSNLKKMLENQQKINEAVKVIMDYFSESGAYAIHMEQFAEAETQIVGLMQLAKTHLTEEPLDELELQTDIICLFLRDSCNYLKMFKPFIEMAEQSKPKEGGRYE